MGREQNRHYPGTYTYPHDSCTVYGVEEPEDLNTLPPIFVLTGAAPQPDEACLAGSVGGLRSGGDRVSKDRLWAALWRWLAAVSRPPDRSPL